MKIAYCLNYIRTMSGGGIERVTVVKANALAEIAGNEVYVIVAENQKKLPLIHPLSPKVHLVNLNVNYYDNTTSSRWRYYKCLWGKKNEHRKRLKDALSDIKPDIVISADMTEKNIIPYVAGSSKIIREFHFKKHSIRKSHFLFDCLKYWYSYRNNGKYDELVVLTNEDKQSGWANDHRVVVIPNPISFVTEETSKLEKKCVIAVGRFEEQKNFPSLIRSFRMVADKHPEWTLEIYGDGSLRWMLQRQIADLGLERNVFLKGYTSDVQSKMLDASCFVLSSLYEGFGLVLTETMMCGLPVVSYACPCGPRDIITEGVDGFLIPVNDEQGMADRICRLIEDKELRQRMGVAAKKKAQRYRLENIIPMWMDLFHRLLEEK